MSHSINELFTTLSEKKASSIDFSPLPSIHSLNAEIAGLAAGIIEALNQLKGIAVETDQLPTEVEIWEKPISGLGGLIDTMADLTYAETTKTGGKTKISQIKPDDFTDNTKAQKACETWNLFSGCVAYGKKRFETLWQFCKMSNEGLSTEPSPSIRRLFIMSMTIDGYDCTPFPICPNNTDNPAREDNHASCNYLIATIAIASLLICLFAFSTFINDSESWMNVVFRFSMALSGIVAVLIVLRWSLPFIEKHELMKQDKNRNDLADRKDDTNRLAFETQLSVWEKKEKTIIDEWVRGREHQRKYELLEHERQLDLANKLVELAKVTNETTQYSFDNGKKEASVTDKTSVLCSEDEKRLVFLDKTSLVLDQQQGACQLQAFVILSGILIKNAIVSWESSNPDTVTVDEGGNVSPHHTGEATVTARYADKAASCHVVVR